MVQSWSVFTQWVMMWKKLWLISFQTSVEVWDECSINLWRHWKKSHYSWTLNLHWHFVEPKYAKCFFQLCFQVVSSHTCFNHVQSFNSVASNCFIQLKHMKHKSISNFAWSRLPVSWFTDCNRVGLVGTKAKFIQNIHLHYKLWFVRKWVTMT